MSRINELFAICKMNNLNCSVTYQKINDFSIEIYTGYKSTYTQVYYSDGYTRPKKAIKNAIQFLEQNY